MISANLPFTSVGIGLTIAACNFGAHTFAPVLSFVLTGTCGGGKSSDRLMIVPSESGAVDSPQQESENSELASNSLDVDTSDRDPGDFTVEKTSAKELSGDTSLPRGVAGADAHRFVGLGVLSSRMSINVFLMHKARLVSGAFSSELASSRGVAIDIDMKNGTACIPCVINMSSMIL